MKKEMKDAILKKLLPPEKEFEKNDTTDDMKIAIGWNMYREELLKLLTNLK